MKNNYSNILPNYLIRTAIAREQKQFIKIAFAVHLSAAISAERYRSDSGALKSAVFNFVFFVMLKNKIEQSAKRNSLLKNLTDRTFENRWSRYKEIGKKVPQAYRVYVEDTFLPCDAGDARIFSKEHEHGLRVSKHIFVGNSRLVTAMTHEDNHGDTTEQTEKRYYYHADHLQSAQFITNVRGEQYEHIEYTPYGELWIEETAPGIDKLPFRFTGKELDEETGLYYYGARYLDPKYSRWLSGDPALNEYIPSPGTEPSKLAGMGGVYNTINLHVYHYAGNNPVKYVDPDGRDIIYLNDQSAVGGNGHGAMLIGNDKDGWIYYSKDGPFESNKDIDPIDDNDKRRRTENGNFRYDKYDSIEAFDKDKAVSGRYNRRVRIKTSIAEDKRMKTYADNHWNDKYNFGIENCSDLVLDTMYSSGNSLLGFALSLGTTDEFFPLTSPNRLYDTLNSIYGESFTSRLGSRIKNKFGVLPRMLVDYLFPKR